MTAHRRFDGQVAIVTGGGRRLRRAAAEALAAEGASVVVASRGLDEPAEVVRGVEARGGTALAVSADIGDASSVAALVDKAVEHFGRVDVLVTAGAAQPAVAASET